MRYLAIALLLSTPAFAQDTQNDDPGVYQHISAGPDILTIGETAASYFEDVADSVAENRSPEDPFYPANMLRDRDGLSMAEIADVLIAAQRVNIVTPEVGDTGQGCKALNAARTPDELLKVLEAGEAAEVAARKRKGDVLLASLPIVTRAHLYRVLIEYRKTITVGRQDWGKVRRTAPEALEAYRAYTCNAVVQK